ncbi:MAG: CarD family transcriptional regulator [Oscillospiraceae bacterium]|nr:CarD family transcriptional regulator [Oscillospiraceae bacterium]
MFQTGDWIVCGGTGVCRVEKIGPLENIRRAQRGRIYYTLIPLCQSGAVYVPVDSTAPMRPALSREKAEDLIGRIAEIGGGRCDLRDQKLVSSHYRSFLETHRCEDLVRLLKIVYCSREESLREGKKPRQVDEHYFRRAKELLDGELSVALGLPPEAVEGYILRRISGSLA